MKKVVKNLKYLRVLSNCKKKMHKAIIQSSDKELISCICECILNCLNGNIKLTEEQKHKLKHYKKAIRKLLYQQNSLKIKKKILVQHGSGILPILIPTIFSALAAFLK
jgi:ABC-type dipeptide/oligopeptide/nickel transport system ATPase subunit